MKKKGLLILGGIMIVAVFAVVIFIISSTGKSTAPAEAFSIDGTWRVYQYAENRVENEFMVFQNGSVKGYRDGNDEAYLNSNFTFESGTLTFSDASKKFAVRIISNNNIIIVEPDTREWKMIKVSDGDRDIKDLLSADLVGDYDVLLVAGEKRTEEVISFTDVSFRDTRRGEEFISASYELISGHLLKMPDIAKEFTCYKNGTALMLIDNVDGYIWELKQK